MASTVPLQCNEVSSSDDDENNENSNTVPKLDSTPKLKRSRQELSMGELLTPKLSRELSALQLSPTSSVISRSRGRTRSSSESQSSNSDTENEAPPNNFTSGQKD